MNPGAMVLPPGPGADPIQDQAHRVRWTYLGPLCLFSDRIFSVFLF